MLVKRLVQQLPVCSEFARLVIGSMVTASAIALGTAGAMSWLGMQGAAIPASLAAIGAAAYAASSRG